MNYTFYRQIHRLSHWGQTATVKGHYLDISGNTLCGKSVKIGSGSLWTYRYASKYALDEYDCKKCIRIAEKQNSMEQQ